VKDTEDLVDVVKQNIKEFARDLIAENVTYTPTPASEDQK